MANSLFVRFSFSEEVRVVKYGLFLYLCGVYIIYFILPFPLSRDTEKGFKL